MTPLTERQRQIAERIGDLTFMMQQALEDSPSGRRMLALLELMPPDEPATLEHDPAWAAVAILAYYWSGHEALALAPGQLEIVQLAMTQRLFRWAAQVERYLARHVGRSKSRPTAEAG